MLITAGLSPVSKKSNRSNDCDTGILPQPRIDCIFVHKNILNVLLLILYVDKSFVIGVPGVAPPACSIVPETGSVVRCSGNNASWAVTLDTLLNAKLCVVARVNTNFSLELARPCATEVSLLVKFRAIDTVHVTLHGLPRYVTLEFVTNGLGHKTMTGCCVLQYGKKTRNSFAQILNPKQLPQAELDGDFTQLVKVRLLPERHAHPSGADAGAGDALDENGDRRDNGDVDDADQGTQHPQPQRSAAVGTAKKGSAQRGAQNSAGNSKPKQCALSFSPLLCAVQLTVALAVLITSAVLHDLLVACAGFGGTRKYSYVFFRYFYIVYFYVFLYGLIHLITFHQHLM